MTSTLPAGSPPAATSGRNNSSHFGKTRIADYSTAAQNAYKAQGHIPSAVAMIRRAARRDPIVMHAHFDRAVPPAGRDRVGAVI